MRGYGVELGERIGGEKQVSIAKKLLNKWKNMSPMAKASVCFSLAMFLQKGLVSLSTPVFTRIMSTVEYEQYTVYYAWSSMISIVATLNLSSGVLNNQLVKGENTREEIISAFQGLSSVWAIGFTLVFAALSMLGMRFSSMSVGLWFLMLLSFAVTPAYDDWMVGRRFTYDYKAPCLLMVVIAILNFVIPLVSVVSSGRKGEARILAAILINMTVGVVFWAYNWRNCHKLFVPRIWKAALTFNLPLLPHFLSLMILNQSDKIMIEGMCQPGQAAIYAVAHTVAAIIQLLMTAINYSLVPWTYQKLKAGHFKEIASKSNVILLMVGVMLGAIMLFAPEIMLIMAPKEYQEAVYIIPPMAAGIYFNYLYQFYGRIELYHEKTRYMTIGSVICAIVNIVLNIIFIDIFGYMAAAYTTLICQMGLCLMHGVLAQRIVRREGYLESPFANRQIAVISMVVLGIALVMPLVFAKIFLRLLLIGGLCIGIIVCRRHLENYVRIAKKR